MPSSAKTTTITHRYEILDQIGKGGMGVVYRALDRLNSKVVALKQMTTATEHLLFASKADRQDFRLALAHEFKTLASLRHPNIVSVLDYGFDAQQKPFFTMTLLEDAKTILEAAQLQPAQIQYDLLTQLLQALVYLHRRGIIHRDLKPSNVLVVNGQVKVLDFGIAIAQGQEAEASGTLAYMAPEILLGDAATPASDLYAVGVIAYELLAGKYPFRLEPSFVLISDILNTTPDITTLQQNEYVTALVERLLAKQPEARYDSASTTLMALRTATGQQVPVETASTRESFLQAARFVGRENELSRLTHALHNAVRNKGALWLVGGESGIGKSRLLDELRTIALVEGILVLRGQAISEGGTPYLIWRDMLRQLCLQTELTALEKSVLKALIPDIATLLEEAIPDAPELEPQAAHDRLVQVISDVFVRQNQPMLVVLEDLHWAGSESIALLNRLSVEVAKQTCLLIATYRSDERPDIPNELSNGQILNLNRLSNADIADLSVSILGEQAGRSKYVTDLLMRETEGNVFFVIEVLRVLAEETGQLDLIGSQPLPQHVFSGGMKTLVQRRLSRIPAWGQALLQIAAVIGRQIDPNLLTAIDTTIAIDNWLTLCADASVLQFQDNEWRFAHDKLREEVLAELTHDKRQELHHLAAIGIEQVYKNEPKYVPALAEHWGIVGDVIKEAHYTGLAGEQAASVGANLEAVNFLERAIVLSQEVGTSSLRLAQLRHLMGMVYVWLGDSDKAFQHLDKALQQGGFRYPASTLQTIRVILGGVLREIQHRFVYDVLKHLPQSGAKSEFFAVLSQACELISQIMYFSNERYKFIYYTLLYQSLAEKAGTAYPNHQSRSYAVMMLGVGAIPFASGARYYKRLAQVRASARNNPDVIVFNELLFGMYAMGCAAWTEAQAHLTTSSELSGKIGHNRRWSEVQYMLAVGCILQGNWQKAKELAHELYIRTLNYADKQLIGGGLFCLALIQAYEQGYEIAKDTLEQSYKLAQEGHDSGAVGNALGALAQNSMRIGMIEHAKKYMYQFLNTGGINTPTAWYVINGYWGASEAALSLWELENSTEHFDLAKRVLHALQNHSQSYSCGQPFALIHQSWMAWLQQQPQKARRIGEQAINVAQQKAMPYAEGLAHYHLGRHLSTVNSRKEHLQQAEVLFERLGAAYDLTRTRELLTQPDVIRA